MAIKDNERLRAVIKIAMLVLVVFVLFIGAAVWFWYLGFWDGISLPQPIARLFDRDIPDAVNADDQFLLERERLAKQEQAVTRLQEDLDRRERGIAFQEEQLQTQEQELLAYETQIEEREKGLISEQNRYENEKAVLSENIEQLNAMRPEDAVAILEEYDDQLLVDTFQVAREISDEQGGVSLVSLWLSLLPPERASAVQRKTVIKYGN